MSIHGEEIFDRLHLKSALRDKNNDTRKLLDYSVGEWLDNYTNNDFLEQFFIQNATGKYLDLWGNLFDIPRKLNENDEDYRNRIVYDGIGNLNVDYFVNIFKLPLYTAIDEFDVENNVLTSNNKYYKNMGFMTVASYEMQKILSNKFVMDSDILFINQDGVTDYIRGVDNSNILKYHMDIFEMEDLDSYFFSYGRGEVIKKLKLKLPNAINCYGFLTESSNVTDIYLDLPNATTIYNLCSFCTSLKKIVLKAPKVVDDRTYFILYGCSNLEYAEFVVPETYGNYLIWFFEYYKNDFTKLDTLIINGEEVEL